MPKSGGFAQRSDRLLPLPLPGPGGDRGAEERAGRQTRMLVRISPASFASATMVDLIRKELAAHGVPGERLWLELRDAAREAVSA